MVGSPFMSIMDKEALRNTSPYLIESLSDFTLFRLRFTLNPLESIHLGPDDTKGDRWRGGFGEALRSLACFYRWEETKCEDCNLSEGCLFYQWFAIDRVHPFIMRPELDGKKVYKHGEDMVLEIVLVGDAISHAKKFVKTIEELGRRGIGRRRGRFCIRQVKGELIRFKDIVEGADPSERLLMELLTPLKMKDHEEGIYIDRFTFRAFFKLLLKRIINLNNLYCKGMEYDKELIESDKQRLFRKAESIEVRAITEWKDYRRYSTRQRKSLRIGGQIGLVEMRGETGAFYPFLKIGEFTGAGSNTTSGFGRYILL